MKKRYCLKELGKIGYNFAISLDNKKFNFDFWDINQIKTKKLSKKLKKKPIINLENYFKKNDAIIDFGNSNPDQTHKLHISLKKKEYCFLELGSQELFKEQTTLRP